MIDAIRAVLEILGFGLLLLAGGVITLNALLTYRGASAMLVVPSILGILGLRSLEIAWRVDMLAFLPFFLAIVALDLGSVLMVEGVVRIYTWVRK